MAATETIRDDHAQRESEQYDVSRSEQHSVGNETQEDHDTSGQSQSQSESDGSGNEGGPVRTTALELSAM